MSKYRKMLSDWEAPYIQSLVRVIETQSKSTLINWAVDYAEKNILPIWYKAYPDDLSPLRAIIAARRWLSGEIKLPEAKRSILLCHDAARKAEGDPVAQAAARAIGQATSTIHSARHCVGLPLYGSLAVAYDELGIDTAWGKLEARAATECGLMLEALLAVSDPDESDPAGISWICR
jgi:hypothetical protein